MKNNKQIVLALLFAGSTEAIQLNQQEEFFYRQ